MNLNIRILVKSYNIRSIKLTIVSVQLHDSNCIHTILMLYNNYPRIFHLLILKFCAFWQVNYFHLSIHLVVCACLCYVYLLLCFTSVFIHMCMHEQTRSQLWMSSLISHHVIFWNRIFSWSWSLCICLGRLTIELLGSACLCSHHYFCCYAQFLMP